MLVFHSTFYYSIICWCHWSLTCRVILNINVSVCSRKVLISAPNWRKHLTIVTFQFEGRFLYVPLWISTSCTCVITYKSGYQPPPYGYCIAYCIFVQERYLTSSSWYRHTMTHTYKILLFSLCIVSTISAWEGVHIRGSNWSFWGKRRRSFLVEGKLPGAILNAQYCSGVTAPQYFSKILQFNIAASLQQYYS